MAVKQTSLRLDRRYMVGLDIAVEQRKEEGYHKPSRTEVIRIALDDYFEKIGVTGEDIKAKLQEAQQPELINTA